MKDEYQKFAGLTVRQIGVSDWDSYKDYYRALPDPFHFAGYLKDKDLDHDIVREEFFNEILASPHAVLFGLFDDDKLVGQSGLYFNQDTQPPSAYLAGSEIADAYRGNRLVDMFYEVRMKYLRDINFQGDISMTIHKDNTASPKVATRNKFENVSYLEDNNYQVWKPIQP